MWIIEWSKNFKNKNKLTFEKLAYEWLEARRKSIKKSTYSNYRYMIDKYLTSRLGKLKAKSIERYDFNEFVEELNEDYSTKTVRDIIVVLKSILRFGETEHNLKLKIKNIISPRQDTEPIIIFSKREVGRLERCCLRENTLRSLGIIICLNTGLRIGEICALRWENIDLEKREITLKKTLQRIY